jgi:hypothetical protein
MLTVITDLPPLSRFPAPPVPPHVYALRTTSQPSDAISAPRILLIYAHLHQTHRLPPPPLVPLPLRLLLLLPRLPLLPLLRLLLLPLPRLLLLPRLLPLLPSLRPRLHPRLQPPLRPLLRHPLPPPPASLPHPASALRRACPSPACARPSHGGSRTRRTPRRA